MRGNQARPYSDQEGARGTIFVLRADLVSAEVRSLLQAVARAVLLGRRGTLSEQVKRLEVSAPAAAPPPYRAPAIRQPNGSPPRPALEFFNGLGGFADDGREYVTILGEGQWTPAPWINVIANPSFGFQVSAEGAGYTWSVNSRENQITPWSNDPVSDRPGEVIYVRDEDTGELWGPDRAADSRGTSRATSARTARATAVFEHTAHGIALELLQYVPLDDSDQDFAAEDHATSRREPGVSRSPPTSNGCSARRAAHRRPFVVTEIDSETGAMLARNSWSTEFGDRVAFADLRGRQISWTGDRTEFLGRNGTLDQSCRARRRGAALQSQSAPALDPCGALQTRVELRPNGATEIVFFLGEAATIARKRFRWSRKYRAADLDAVLAAVDPAMGRRPRHGPGDDTRPRDGHHAEPLAALSDARLPRVGALGLLPGERRLWLSRSASGRDGADACRGRTSRASICCARPRGSSSTATFSTGGFRHRARACARGSPTIASGSPLRRRPLCRGRPAISAVLDETVAVSRRPRAAPKASTEAYFQPTVVRRAGHRSSNTARGRSISASRSAATACR